MINLIIGFLVGIMLGSLVDCIATRSLTGESFWGRSHCPKCKKHLKWYDLFPVASYLMTKGRCRYCKTKISIEYPLIEILMGVIISLLFFQALPANLLTLKWPDSILLISDLTFKSFVICVLVAVLITDLKSGLIPDRITYPSILITLIYLISLTIYKIYLLYQSLLQSVLGKYLLPPNSDYFYRHAYIMSEPLVLGLIASLLLGLFFLSLIVLTRGRGMGGGDLKLGLFLGLVFGLPNSIAVLMLAFLTGSIVGIALILFGKKKLGQTIPFGPFLSFGAIIAIFFGEQLLKLYSGLKII